MTKSFLLKVIKIVITSLLLLFFCVNVTYGDDSVEQMYIDCKNNQHHLDIIGIQAEIAARIIFQSDPVSFNKYDIDSLTKYIKKHYSVLNENHPKDIKDFFDILKSYHRFKDVGSALVISAAYSDKITEYIMNSLENTTINYDENSLTILRNYLNMMRLDEDYGRGIIDNQDLKESIISICKYIVDHRDVSTTKSILVKNEKSTKPMLSVEVKGREILEKSSSSKGITTVLVSLSEPLESDLVLPVDYQGSAVLNSDYSAGNLYSKTANSLIIFKGEKEGYIHIIVNSETRSKTIKTITIRINEQNDFKCKKCLAEVVIK